MIKFLDLRHEPDQAIWLSHFTSSTHRGGSSLDQLSWRKERRIRYTDTYHYTVFSVWFSHAGQGVWERHNVCWAVDGHTCQSERVVSRDAIWCRHAAEAEGVLHQRTDISSVGQLLRREPGLARHWFERGNGEQTGFDLLLSFPGLGLKSLIPDIKEWKKMEGLRFVGGIKLTTLEPDFSFILVLI